MFIDHATLILYRHYRSSIARLDYASIQRINLYYKTGRAIGRIAFPIFCFILVEGFFHTRSLCKYLLRLFITALASEHAFNLLHSGKHLDISGQNVFITLLLSLLTITAIDLVRKRFVMSESVSSAVTIAIAFAGCAIAALVKCDYSYHGVFSVVIFYLLHYSMYTSLAGGALSFVWEPFALMAFVPLSMYNGTRRKGFKYGYYIFYPAHIYLLYLIITYALPQTF